MKKHHISSILAKNFYPCTKVIVQFFSKQAWNTSQLIFDSVHCFEKFSSFKIICDICSLKNQPMFAKSSTLVSVHQGYGPIYSKFRMQVFMVVGMTTVETRRLRWSPRMGDVWGQSPASKTNITSSVYLVD